MKFGPVPVAKAEGAVVAHAIHVEGLVLKKGDVVRADHIDALQAARLDSIVVAQLESGDLQENEAARRIAEAVGGLNVSLDRPFTGRTNLFARSAGVLTIDVAAVDRLNGVDEAVTLATLPAFRAVVPGEMVATVKIIPFAVSAAVVEGALATMRKAAIDVAVFRPLKVGVISTLLPGLKPAVIAKTLSYLQDRLDRAGAAICLDERVPHDVGALTRALRACTQHCDLIVVFGASAITDRRDVIPSALEAAGGRIEHFGMPVDPGNLLLLGDLEGRSVIGAPGCARSPKENGFDWVLHRLLAGLPVSRKDIRGLGVGGLLMEIVTRPQPRTGDAGRRLTAGPKLRAPQTRDEALP